MVIRVLVFSILIGNAFLIRVERIVGGFYTEIEMAPYMLSLRANGKHRCGAVLIGKEWGLTAAHCCIERTSSGPIDLTVRGSSSRLYGPCGLEHRITRVVRHSGYRGDNDDWDLCAIKLYPPVEFTNRFAPVGLPELRLNDDKHPPPVSNDISFNHDEFVYATVLGEEDKTVPERAVVSGWGSFQVDGNTPSPILKSLNVTKVDLQICKNVYRDKYIVHDRDVCYGTGIKSEDTCKGDSGGPLVSEDSILVGIVSFGDECGYSILPGIYTDIFQFREWIERTTGL
ncbi:hypothetical protein QAD02_008901 [Eretmocerus hayati]|uniref:Uncharacterized protein n=1 Tax=Eretmocerus hayati TaxID=131215 RepID=A0ACC2N7Q6_9HYME|nr:hypothetical protein QAD02_008901 [Eretmocerus hayati]